MNNGLVGREGTAREAFALAGHPVPEGAKLFHIKWSGWFAVAGKEVFSFSRLDGLEEDQMRWQKTRLPKYHSLENLRIDLSRVPVEDCISELPKIVRAAISKRRSETGNTEANSSLTNPHQKEGEA